jgi:hypothetical protein
MQRERVVGRTEQQGERRVVSKACEASDMIQFSRHYQGETGMIL